MNRQYLQEQVEELIAQIPTLLDVSNITSNIFKQLEDLRRTIQKLQKQQPTPPPPTVTKQYLEEQLEILQTAILKIFHLKIPDISNVNNQLDDLRKSIQTLTMRQEKSELIVNREHLKEQIENLRPLILKKDLVDQLSYIKKVSARNSRWYDALNKLREHAEDMATFSDGIMSFTFVASKIHLDKPYGEDGHFKTTLSTGEESYNFPLRRAVIIKANAGEGMFLVINGLEYAADRLVGQELRGDWGKLEVTASKLAVSRWVEIVVEYIHPWTTPEEIILSY